MSAASLHVARTTRWRASFALGLLVAGLAGCASDLSLSLNPAAGAEAYGVFTGEFVDGLPLYRFPTIVVVGSRRESADHDD